MIVEEANLHVQVSTLRKLLGAGVIETIPGRGYRFGGKLEGREEEASRPTPSLPALPELIGRDDELASVAARASAGRRALRNACSPAPCCAAAPASPCTVSALISPHVVLIARSDAMDLRTYRIGIWRYLVMWWALGPFLLVGACLALSSSERR